MEDGEVALLPEQQQSAPFRLWRTSFVANCPAFKAEGIVQWSTERFESIDLHALLPYHQNAVPAHIVDRGDREAASVVAAGVYDGGSLLGRVRHTASFEPVTIRNAMGRGSAVEPHDTSAWFAAPDS
jgi:hypothetical protein